LNSKFAILIAVFSIVSVPAAYASGQSAYQSGYGHGRDDCDESPDDRYINEPGKGRSHHTSDFNRGYDAGFSSCGGSSGGSGSSGGGSRESLATKLCNIVDNNRGEAALLARALGYPGLDSAVLALCDRNN
jgi:hypothetical protein